MAKDTSLNGIRNEMIHSLYGRRLGVDQNNLLVGHTGERVPAEGWSSGGSTFPSSSPATLSAFGLTVGGTTGSSGSTAASPACQQLPAPVPGVRKLLFNASTAMFTAGTTAAAAYFMSTGSAGSTYQYVTLWGKGVSLELIGLTTALWGVLGNPMTTVSTNVSFV